MILGTFLTVCNKLYPESEVDSMSETWRTMAKEDGEHRNEQDMPTEIFQGRCQQKK